MAIRIIGVRVKPCPDEQADLEAVLGSNPNGDAIRKFLDAPSHALSTTSTLGPLVTSL